MQVFVHLDELLTPELLQQHQRHIVDFLEMEGITPEAEVGRTKINERAVKELLAELAHDLDQAPDSE